MQAFNTQLTRAMNLVNRTVTCVSYGSSGGQVVLHGINGDENTVINYNGGPSEGQVIFLDSSFGPHRRTGLYRIERAVARLLSEEQRTKEQRKAAAEARKQRAENEKKREFARQITKNVEGTGAIVEVPYYGDGEYKFSFTTTDQATLMAMIDYLQDGGFMVVKQEKPETEAE